MSKNSIAKIASISAAVAMTLGFAGNVGAATSAELQAQINLLIAQLSALQGTTVSTTFTISLTVGSKGPQVVALQNYLEAKGYLVMPSGVSKGYFGGLTRAAVARFQVANSISPAVGYFGPTTRGVLNAMVATGGTTVPGTTTGGTTGSTGGTSGVITTPGVEGTMTVTLNPTPGSGATVRENDQKVGILGLKIEAKRSDIQVQRVKLDLGTDATMYTKVFSTLYLVDDSGSVVATAPLNSTTVSKETTNYFITISGFNYVVSANTTKVLVVKGDVMGSFSAATLATPTRTIAVPANGVRGRDGAGIDQYGPSTAFSRSVTLAASLADAATFQLSLNSSTAKSVDVIANGGANNNEADQVVLGSVDLRAEKDNILFRNFTITIAKTGTGTATATTAYLFDGSTQVASASVNSTSGVATFSNFDLPVAKDTTKTLVVKVDIRSANGTSASLSLSAVGSIANVTAENSQGSQITTTGSATSNVMVVRNIGPVFTLLSKAVTRTAGAGYAGSTSTVSATFNVQVKAVGADILFGHQASATPMFVFGLYQGSTLTTLLVASSSSLTLPSTGTVVAGTNSFTIQRNNTVTIPVNFILEARTANGAAIATNNYAVGIEAINWVANGVANSSTYMSAQSDWRTDYVALP